jgi:hypothetical protein
MSPMLLLFVEELNKYCIDVLFKSMWYFYQVCEN